MKNLDCKCLIISADEYHYQETHCEEIRSEGYLESDKFTCGESWEWHEEGANEIADYIKCESCKVKEADEKFMNNLVKGK